MEAITNSKGDGEYLEQKNPRVGRLEMEESIPLQPLISDETLVFCYLNPCPVWLFVLRDLASGRKSKMGETHTEN